MSTRFIPIDHNQPLLLPPDLRDWIPDDDLVHFVIEAVNGLNLNVFKVNVKGSGSAQYPPHVMLALLIYCYANGIFSSRRIERATYRDIAVRYLTGDTHPDHDTIDAPKMNILVAVRPEVKRHHYKHDFRVSRANTKPLPTIRSPFTLAMKEKMQRPESREKYRLRKQTIEPVFGTIKKWMGFTQFQLRGHEKVSGEWELVTLAYNMKRLWKMQNHPKQAVSSG